MNGGGSPPKKRTSTGNQGVKKQLRLHGQQFRIRLLDKSPKYDKIRARANYMTVDKNTLRLHASVLEVYSNVSFTGTDINDVTAESFEYWNCFFKRIEYMLDVLILKPKYQNIRLVKSGHYSEIGNELSQECLKTGQKVRVFSRDDGKLWFLIDNSFNLEEAETVHPESSQNDMEAVIQPFFDDMRTHPPIKLSELTWVIKKALDAQAETAEGLNAVVKLMTPVQNGAQDEHKGRPDYAL